MSSFTVHKILTKDNFLQSYIVLSKNSIFTPCTLITEKYVLISFLYFAASKDRVISISGKKKKNMTWNSRILLALVGYQALLSSMLRLAQVKRQIKKNSDAPSLVQFCTNTTLLMILKTY